MSITVKPVTPAFVAEISGLDLAQPLKTAAGDAIEAAIDPCGPIPSSAQRTLQAA